MPDRRISTRSLFLIAFMVCALLAGLSCRKSEKAAPEKAESLDFTLEDVQSNKVTLSGLKGKVVLVEFWATWCPPCRDSVPEVNKLHEKFKDRNFEVLAVSLDRGGNVRSDLSSFIKENKIAYRILLDDGDASSAFGVTNIPVIFLIDKQGKLVKKQIGFIPELAEALTKEIEALL